ncbi:DUF3152 domain-containing protein [Angustibacter sp. Root456]|uniref:DUF3152 domain-containing protein n=1 Tax=Angustibacter sp. Root456 TaxID=1736539 RepID=UPI001910AD8B|nr:DUF3152 domain-containing protein [Angustibacter sp. Root456]
MTSSPRAAAQRRAARRRAVQRRRRQAAGAVVALVVALGGWGLARVVADDPPVTPTADVTAVSSPSPTASGSAPSSAVTTASPAASPSASPRVSHVVSRGTGRLVPVSGSDPAPGRGTTTTVRVEVEDGVDVDRAAFADAVLATLNDDRSWGHGGRRSFARTDGDADVVVVLASPDTSARLCRPLQTFGKLSCRSGQRAVLTSYRWLLGTPEFPDLTVYRQYVVNHEVGHVLGHGHEQCGGAGRLAPVMQQQTKRVAPCRPNAWPYP